MGVVPSRQVAILSIANYDGVCSTDGLSAGFNAMVALRKLATGCGANPEHIRMYQDNTLLIRLDELPREQFLDVIRIMTLRVRDVDAFPSYKTKPCVRVGAMSEQALRSFVNDAAASLLSYMNHNDCEAAFLTGDELDIWQSLESTGIEFLSNEQLKHMDSFTGLLNDRYFTALLQDVLDNRSRHGESVWVLYFDIDDFKSYNRAYTHKMGDDLLLFVAHEIRLSFPTDIVAHLSVDRFAVLSDSPDIARKCATIHEATRAFQEAYAPEIKCGVFELEDEIKTAQVALDCAKLACESIKGRYDVVYRYFGDDLRERLFERRYVARHAEQAVSERWIRSFAQPVVDARTGEVCGFEALARWHDPVRGILSPALFIPTLEEAHLIHKLDTCIVDEVCDFLSQRIAKEEPVYPISINLSRLDFKLCDIFSVVLNLCDHYKIPHELLAMEVTESALDGSSNLRREMDRFRAAGFEVWMDDFGCGYSSLNLLKDYEFDVLKVDMEFLRDMESNKRSKTIVASVIGMARSLGIRTLVEGVETVAQQDFLKEAGCDMMQGYFFGKPAPLESAFV